MSDGLNDNLIELTGIEIVLDKGKSLEFFDEYGSDIWMIYKKNPGKFKEWLRMELLEELDANNSKKG